MTKPLAPILIRANITRELRKLREVLRYINEHPERDYIDAMLVKDIQKQHDDLKHEFIFKVYDSECK